jgi:hypothetical protein
VDGWEEAREGLAQWKLVSATSGASLRLQAPGLKWALAALLIIGIGIGVGRASAPRPDLEAIQAAVAASLRSSLVAEVRQQVETEIRADWQAALAGEPGAVNTAFRQDLRSALDQWAAKASDSVQSENQRRFADFVDTYRANRQQERRAMLALVNRAEQKHQAEILDMRRAVETVAVVAADKFQRTETELDELASYAQFASDESDESETFEPTKQLNQKGN